MAESRHPQVLIVGGGAIGSFYGSILHRAGAAVSVVCRSDFDVVREQGFRIRSPLGDLSFRPDAVLSAVEECTPSPDFLVLSVKVLDDVDRAALIRSAVGPATAIVLIENGIEIESEIAEAFPDNQVISGLAFVGVSRVAPGEIEHKAYGQLTLGNYPSGASDEARQFAALLKEGGIKGVVSEQVVTERWRKTVWNAPFNPIAVLGGGADTETMLNAEGGEATIRGLMAEVVAVAEAAGHKLPDDIIDTNIANTHKMPPYKNSMALDWINGRPLELEAILGNVLREARRVGVAVPRLETVYGAVKMLQRTKQKEG